ncbi:hypothetical protein EG340_11915 [Chryseobacterium indoltheticum]|uniref:Uncharacterized protein n=1 Tax=Chryseobacterium indoltheticum TaxID=254 RepID=A0A3G6N141_9FLAO|nr:hypothetical protein EG340_11915 [Chryseobacterium indoltheticum]
MALIFCFKNKAGIPLSIESDFLIKHLAKKFGFSQNLQQVYKFWLKPFCTLSFFKLAKAHSY